MLTACFLFNEKTEQHEKEEPQVRKREKKGFSVSDFYTHLVN